VLTTLVNNLAQYSLFLHGSVGVLDDGPFLIAVLGLGFAVLCFAGHMLTSRTARPTESDDATTDVPD
jgi:hypothetical protein